MGVGWMAWSSDGLLLATKEEAHPRCLWVWRPLQARLEALLVLAEPLQCARWRSAGSTAVLAFCSSSGRVGLWSSEVVRESQEGVDAGGGGVVSVVQGLVGLGVVQGLKWSADGQHLLVRGKDHFAMLGPAELHPLLGDFDQPVKEQESLIDNESSNFNISSPEGSSVFLFDNKG